MLLRPTALPFWYVIAVAYTAMLGILALRQYATVAAALRVQERASTDPHDQGQLAGRRVGGWVRACAWLVAAALLLTGRWWAIAVVVLAYARSMPHIYRDYAVGFAEGYRAAQLAAAPEYVRGRVATSWRDRAVALAYVLATRALPMTALVVALIQRWR